MSDTQFTIQLKQHTPIIHFQHYQEGATLRASEIKPKLDRFLIKKLKLTEYKKNNGKNVEMPREVYKNWFNNKEKLSLNYSVNVSYENDFTYYLPLPLKLDSKKHPLKSGNLISYIKGNLGLDVIILAPTPYFANADKIKFLRNDAIDSTKTEIKKLIFAKSSNNQLVLTFNSWCSDLIEKICKNISSFFLSHNFGMRQDKAFGSFTVNSINNEKIMHSENELKPFFIMKATKVFTDLNPLFEFIFDEYQLLKSGKNRPNYKKSALFNYFVENDIRWEKRYLKQKINSNKIMSKDLYWDRKSAPIDIEEANKGEYHEWIDKQKNDYKYVRALLGLAEQFEFSVFSKDQNGKLYQDSKNDYIISIKHKPEEGKDKIERFPSPIFFKVISGCVYLGISDSYKKILNENFEFQLRLKGDRDKTVINIDALRTPKEFDLRDFLEKYKSNNWTNL